jgi:hypothetical protein
VAHIPLALALKAFGGATWPALAQNLAIPAAVALIYALVRAVEGPAAAPAPAPR